MYVWVTGCYCLVVFVVGLFCGVNSVVLFVSFCACVFVAWLTLFAVPGCLGVLLILLAAVDCARSLGWVGLDL